MSYCYMIAPILSYKVCSSVSSLFPVCNCGLILYRKKEVMTRIINKLIRVFSGLSKTFGLETASEFGNTMAIRSLCYHKFLQRLPDRVSLYSELFFSFTCGGRSRSALSRIKSGAGYLETSEKFPAGIIWCRLA